MVFIVPYHRFIPNAQTIIHQFLFFPPVPRIVPERKDANCGNTGQTHDDIGRSGGSTRIRTGGGIHAGTDRSTSTSTSSSIAVMLPSILLFCRSVLLLSQLVLVLVSLSLLLLFDPFGNSGGVGVVKKHLDSLLMALL